ncbi:MAG: SusD/RagB family nutrient-binding outer membrane lipoprotein [Cyclobacteriaceae bacterium]
MKKIFSIFSILLLMSCADEVLNINDNPNLATEAELNLLLTGAEATAGFWTNRTANEDAMVLSRQLYRLAPSQYSIGPDNINNDFNGLYSAVLKEFQRIIDQGTEEERFGLVGISQVYKAYIFGLMVDLWGDIPYSDALNGETNISPQFEGGKAIYDKLLLLLDEAKGNLDAGIANKEVVSGDIVLNGSLSRYKKVANTVKLRLLLNLRLTEPARATTEINALIAENNFVDDNNENFVFRYGTAISPLNQNPLYQQDYTGSGGKTFYMDNYFMYKMHNRNDPRIRYYINRQGDNTELDFDTTPCSSRSDCTYATLLLNDASADGLIGRDHGDPSGIPGDNTLRATWGVYPIGGIYDDGSKTDATLGAGANGGGIMPWLIAANTKFMLAEAALQLGTTGDPELLFTQGMDLSIEYVYSMGNQMAATAPSPTNATIQTAKTTYINNRVAAYQAASNNGKLNLIIEEKFAAQFGNGFDSYTDFRRTGSPNDMPASLQPLAPFLTRFPYGRSELVTNPNAPNPAPLNSEKVFWDN